MNRLVLTLSILAAFVALPIHAAGKDKTTGSALQMPINGTTAAGEIFSGTFTLQRFATDEAGKLVAVGTIAGTASSAGQIVATGLQTVALPVTVGQSATSAVVVAQASCPILHLVLGPLHLDLLGLVVDLNRVVLDITAVPGAGNLLGNLLCAITGILDPTGLADVLNQILAILQGL